MDGAKNVMYAQAGRSYGWNKVYPAGKEPADVMPPAVVISMPEPPVVELPLMEPVVVGATIVDATIVEMPEFMKPQRECQELAMAYVQMQKWQELYETEHGFSCGTIFAELDLPFMGKGACKDE